MKNAAATLADCLNSCLGQTIDCFELMIVDDHSEDNSIALAQQLTNHLPTTRVHIVKNSGMGLVDALNTGLNASSAEFVARMDSDDIMLPSRLEKQLSFLRNHPNIEVLGTQVDIFPQAEIKDGFASFVNWQNTLLTNKEIQHSIYVETPITHPSVMFRREVILANGAYRKGDFPEDYELWLRLASKGVKFAKLAERLLQWRESPNRLSRTAINCRADAFNALRASYLQHDDRLSDGTSLVVWGAGRITRKRVKFLLLANNTLKVERWIDVNPNKIGNKIADVPISEPDWLANCSPKPFVLVYVNNRGAREEITDFLQKIDYKAGLDYLAVG
ncbi:MAG: glycosyltransferase involved in cell wall biosynthesis [Saprospiraceae bacterium]|jgi:glycosyltransferase involved in cell wall biosynthesis